MSKKMHDILRILQLVIPDIASLYCILDRTFGWGQVSLIESLVPYLLAIISHIAQASSNGYFATKTIIDKIPEDTEPESEE